MKHVKDFTVAATVAFLAIMLPSASGTAQTGGAAPIHSATDTIHPLLKRYQRSLHAWLPTLAQSRLEVIDMSGTDRGANDALAFLAADHAVHRYAPAALEAAGRPFEAGQLRTLAAVTDATSADRAIDRMRTVLDACRHADRSRNGLDAAIASVEAAKESVIEAKAESQRALAAPDALQRLTPSAHANIAVLASSRAGRHAVRAGADESSMGELALQSIDDLIARARASSPPAGGALPEQPSEQPRANPRH